MAPSLRGTRLRPIGRLARADASGRLSRLGRAPAGKLGAAVIIFTRVLHDRVGDPDLSIILRGSLARGSRSSADIDLTLISTQLPTLPPMNTLPPLPLPVEAGLVPLRRFRDPARGA